MSKRSIDKQVYDQYVDATVALFMEHYAAALTDTVLAEESSPATCSEGLERRCMEMIRKECAKQKRKEIYKGINKCLRSAAVILIALLSLSSILFMTVEAFRVPVINFFIEQGDGFWAITGKSEDEPIDSAFDPNDPLAGLLPEGYELVDMEGNKRNGEHYYYKNEYGRKIELWVLKNIVDVTLDSENASVSLKCDVAGCEGVLVIKENFAQLAWVNRLEEESYILSADVLNGDALLDIAEQMVKHMAK